MSAGGGLSSVERDGETVRRGAGTWTPTVHALLRHLHDAGFAGAPRPLGLESGVEILTFVHGGEATHSDEELARVGEFIRAFHSASRSFVAPADAPDNTVYEPRSVPCAFIDWDLAAPAPPIWDFAWAAYRFVPLYDDATCERLGYPAGRQAERLRIVCDAYGLEEHADLLPTVCERIRVLYETARAWGEEGRPGWRDVWRDTRGEQWLRGLRHVEAQSAEWQRSL